MATSTKQGAACSAAGRKCYNAAAIVSDVLERLLRETARDGMVKVDDAVRILKLVGRGTYELDVAFDHQEKTCRAALLPGRDKASSRNNPFRRLMVRPFETLLNGEPAPYPRALLPNYFDLLAAAYGEKYGEYERHSRALLQALLVTHGHNLDWDAYYAEPKVAQIMGHALRRLTKFLEGAGGQMSWVQLMSRPAPSGLRPSAEQTDFIRNALDHTVKGLDLLSGATRQAGTA